MNSFDKTADPSKDETRRNKFGETRMLWLMIEKLQAYAELLDGKEIVDELSLGYAARRMLQDWNRVMAAEQSSPATRIGESSEIHQIALSQQQQIFLHQYGGCGCVGWAVVCVGEWGVGLGRRDRIRNRRRRVEFKRQPVPHHTPQTAAPQHPHTRPLTHPHTRTTKYRTNDRRGIQNK